MKRNEKSIYPAFFRDNIPHNIPSNPAAHTNHTRDRDRKLDKFKDKRKSINRIVKGYDIVMIISLILVMTVRFLSVVYFHMTARVSGATITAVTSYYEANPLAAFLINMGNVAFMIEMFLIPALVITLYMWSRRAVLKRKMPVNLWGMHISLFFVLMLLNFVNDAGAVLGRLL